MIKKKEEDKEEKEAVFMISDFFDVCDLMHWDNLQSSKKHWNKYSRNWIISLQQNHNENASSANYFD